MIENQNIASKPNRKRRTLSSGMKKVNKLVPKSKEIHIHLPEIFILYLILAIVLDSFFPIERIILFPYTLLGIPLFIFGLTLNSQAKTQFSRKKTTEKLFNKSSTLLKEGPFGFSRNPIYLSAVVLLMGVAVLLGSLLALFTPIALLITFDILFIRYEEKIQEKTFGNEYLAYKKRVRRWI